MQGVTCVFVRAVEPLGLPVGRGGEREGDNTTDNTTKAHRQFYCCRPARCPPQHHNGTAVPIGVLKQQKARIESLSALLL